MKRILLVLALLCVWRAGCAAEETVPAGIVALCKEKYPGYQIAAYDVYGSEAGYVQCPLVLSRAGDNILCIAEKALGEPAYTFTVENTNAVREGDDVPTLLIDTGGDVLYYAYHDGDQYMTDYRSVKTDGVWGRPSVIYLDMSNVDYDLDTQIWVDGGFLRYRTDRFDKLENRMDSGDLSQPAPIPVSESYVQSLALATFDIDAISLAPWDMNAWPGLCDGLLAAGDTLLGMDVQETSIIMRVGKADGTQRLRLAGWDGQGYTVEETGPLEDDASIDSFHMGEGALFIVTDGGGCYHNFSKREDGKWYLSSVQADDSFSIRYDSINDFENYAVLQNDGVIYGKTPWNADITQLDLTNLPRTLEEAVAQIDSSRYALVNNPNPADRLNLRAKPDKGSQSLGKFYNRTPVYVMETKGDWVRVRIGSEEGGIEGWMMKQFLAFGEAMDDVECAFPQLVLGSAETDEQDVKHPLLSAPKESASVRAMVSHSQGIYIVGVVGDEWYVVLTSNGVVGYARQSDFWEGNG